MSVFVRQNAIAMEYTKDSWAILNPIEQSIKAKIEKYGTPLKEWDVSIYRGILTGCNEAFIISGEQRKKLIDEDAKSDEIIRPILRGRDIKRYGYEFADLWLINIECGFTNKHRGDIPPEDFIKSKYPAIYKHFMQVANAKTKGKGLINRDDKGDYWWELRSCAYTNDFSKQKIIYPNMTKYLPFIYDENGYMTNQKCFILLGNTNTNLQYLTAFLNSNIAKKWIIDNCPELQGGTRELSKIFFEKIKIPHISEEEADSLAKIVTQKLCSCSSVKEYNEVIFQINEIVYKIYKLNTCEIQYINDYVEKRME